MKYWHCTRERALSLIAIAQDLCLPIVITVSLSKYLQSLNFLYQTHVQCIFRNKRSTDNS